MADKEKYFNFPIVLLDGFLTDTRSVLENISDYALYAHAFNHYEYEDEVKQIKAAASFYNIKLYNENKIAANGQELFDSLPENLPKVGINFSVWWDYYKNDKSDFEKVCLLAHLAIKSIIGKKPFCKINNNYLLARMDGKRKTIADLDELSPQIQQFANRYQLDKVKTELRLNWNLKLYSRYTRGFYVSYSMPLNDLVLQAEKKRRSRLTKQLDDDQKAAIQRAIQKLDKPQNQK